MVYMSFFVVPTGRDDEESKAYQDLLRQPPE